MNHSSQGFFNKLTIGQQLFGLMFVTLITFAPTNTYNLLQTRTAMMHEKHTETQNVVETAYGILQHFAAQAENGVMTEEEAQTAAASSISQLRYGDENYFWIQNLENKMVMHPLSPHLNGQPLNDVKTVDGIAVFTEMVAVVNKNGEGFIDYRWPLPGSDEVVEKTSFVQGFDRWQWILGSGIYLNDVDAMFWSEVKKQALTGAIASLLIALLYWLIVQRITTPLKNAIAVASSISEGRLNNQIDVRVGGETGQLLHALSVMQSSLQERVEQNRMSAQEINRLKQAVDNVSANVMVADINHDVIYQNSAALNMFAAAHLDIQTVQPQFDANRLAGRNISKLLDNSDYLNLLNHKLAKTSTCEFEFAKRTFKVIASPITDADGQYQGVVVEWRDRTEERAVENDVQRIVQSAENGELSQRLELEGKQGFFLTLGRSVNNLLNVNEQIVSDMQRVLGAMAKGELSHTIERDYHGAFEQLKNDTNVSINRLKEIVGKVQYSAKRIYEVTETISEGNNKLAKRTEEQSLNLEKTAASMEEMNASVQQNALNVSNANKVAMQARSEAEEGGSVVQNTVSSMGEINSSSNKISDIIGVIDEIAFQTNLLALNAAVEAARAGEQGKGFAVVANEVGNLAKRSSTAAGEIKRLIEDSMAKVTDGSRMVDESGVKLEQIVSSVTEVSTIIGNITTAGKDQVIEIDQVNQAMIKMEEMTKKNTTLVEKSATASASMKELAEDLNGLLEFFHLGNSELCAPLATKGFGGLKAVNG